jgi:hypothetical protein
MGAIVSSCFNAVCKATVNKWSRSVEKLEIRDIVQCHKILSCCAKVCKAMYAE